MPISLASLAYIAAIGAITGLIIGASLTGRAGLLKGAAIGTVTVPALVQILRIVLFAFAN